MIVPAHSRTDYPDLLASWDQIHIRNLMVRGIVGINPEERKNRQDILVNVTLYADTRVPGLTDDISDTVNYRSIAKAIIAHIETGKPNLVEHLAARLVTLCFDADSRIEAVRITVEKPGAVRFAESVGISLIRLRANQDASEKNQVGCEKKTRERTPVN